MPIRLCVAPVFVVLLFIFLFPADPIQAQGSDEDSKSKATSKVESEKEKGELKEEVAAKEQKKEEQPKPKAKKQTKVKPSLPASIADQTNWRSIGPANMGGRITAITVYEKDPSIWWAATASGGLLKTTNNGRTLEHQFDDQATVSIGDVQVAQSNPEIVWVGTGESNPRNSVSWGDGVYKSADGGKTWKNMGLKKSFQIGALAIHPENPDVVWVGALGRLWGPNEERGLFKTTDGGKNWKKVLFVDDKTGIVDVQLDPKNPENLLVATYERKRDGFDGNDPEQRFGEGSGIHRSTDGGETFERITEGLPSCKMGRIGLDYFEADPNIVVAVVESEKIAKRPEKSPFLGIRGENADVGARLTNITKGGPCDKAGLKDDDIVIAVQDNIVMSYNDFLGEVRKHQAGEKIKVLVSRERKQVEVEVELGERPKSGNNSTRTEFSGTLGGQAANLQGQQGPDDHDYGGIYLSEDGGVSWKRINSLNPRPMYYSNIQIDPVDRNNIYLCGTSLYKSKDGGETFTGDGGSDGIHVDHHALWIDKRDPRHMILGNDGGVHVTYDRMEHWDHLNHVAIGQFYHVGVDTSMNYKVYGGLQDNGSWGGPSRGGSGGAVNSDWLRVGGGDGFVTLVDPNDPNEIYFESQNGGMGRINLETGSRGFIRPRPPKGTRYRFNWKTPFLLSPHNSKMHYSAGNYVFRSFDRGNGIKAISPEITNTSKGAGSAISESPVQPGLIYVGTTDGAVWKTEDGGSSWEPLAYQPVKEEKKEEGKKDGKSDKEKSEKEKTSDKSDDPSAEKEEASSGDDPVSGAWTGRMISDRIPEDRAEFNFELELDGTKVTGSIEGRRGNQDISEGTFDPETGEISWSLEGRRGAREYSGKIEDGKMTGEMSVSGRDVQMEFTASKGDGKPKKTAGKLQLSSLSVRNALVGILIIEDPISGQWTGVVENENLPGGKVEFTINIKMDDKSQLSGTIKSAAGDSDIVEGSYDSETGKIIFDAENDEISIFVEGEVDGAQMTGSMSINDGMLDVDFDAAKKEPKEEDDQEEAETGSETEKESAEEVPTESAKDEASESVEKEDKEQKPVKRDPNDLVSGQWEGNMVSQRGEREMKLALNFKSNDEITGTFESTQGEREISSGKFDPETNSLSLYSETDQFTLQFTGTVKGDQYEGEIDINEGSFTMEFDVTRQSKEVTAEKAEPKKDATKAKKEQYKQPTGEKSLSKLLPGPRWVSSIEASKFKKERCYMTFDGHRSNDDGIYVFATEDGGKTWESLTTNLPKTAGSARVLREDTKNENLLFLGCEFSSWYTIDRGQTWTRIKGGLPTVAVHEFAIHDKRQEVVAATHGRSLWIADISVLRQMTKETLTKDVHLFQPRDAISWSRQPARGNSGTRRFVGTNPSSGTIVAYSLGKSARIVRLTLHDLKGDVVKTFETSGRKGYHQINWDLSRDQAGGQRRFAGSVRPGKYLLTLSVDGEKEQKVVNVVGDPTRANQSASAEFEDELFGY
ncbi:VPS10 domain-containing protein [Mariniblastus fucicola]|uniref:Serine endoprotease n=1 Tax=Mariniblastus fucicola TaxID=980251 RepID=A0A5B9PAT3_9BACT|nr:PDZ domain-containing protein [Mariniblastus fucicola]QEG21616.1 serine endoprotease [Mariniblastus fucicola]